MSRNTVSLDVLDVARPCPVDWNEMRGDEQVRFCGHCSLHVYNLSEMSRSAAEGLVRETEGRMCVRFYRRADGTVTTRDCGLKAAAKRLGRWASTATAVVLSGFVAAMGLTRASHASPTEKRDRPTDVTPLMGKIRPPTSPPVAIMGDVATPALPATQPAVFLGQARIKMGELAPAAATQPAAPPAAQPSTQPVTSE